jgi:hypothetical protein
MPASEYQVRITSSNGDDELAEDGIFKNTLWLENWKYNCFSSRKINRILYLGRSA